MVRISWCIVPSVSAAVTTRVFWPSASLTGRFTAIEGCCVRLSWRQSSTPLAVTRTWRTPVPPYTTAANVTVSWSTRAWLVGVEIVMRNALAGLADDSGGTAATTGGGAGGGAARPGRGVGARGGSAAGRLGSRGAGAAGAGAGAVGRGGRRGAARDDGWPGRSRRRRPAAGSRAPVAPELAAGSGAGGAVARRRDRRRGSRRRDGGRRGHARGGGVGRRGPARPAPRPPRARACRRRARALPGG